MKEAQRIATEINATIIDFTNNKYSEKVTTAALLAEPQEAASAGCYSEVLDTVLAKHKGVLGYFQTGWRMGGAKDLLPHDVVLGDVVQHQPAARPGMDVRGTDIYQLDRDHVVSLFVKNGQPNGVHVDAHYNNGD
jgi:hypothetical protein